MLKVIYFFIMIYDLFLCFYLYLVLVDVVVDSWSNQTYFRRLWFVYIVSLLFVIRIMHFRRFLFPVYDMAVVKSSEKKVLKARNWIFWMDLFWISVIELWVIRQFVDFFNVFNITIETLLMVSLDCLPLPLYSLQFPIFESLSS